MAYIDKQLIEETKAFLKKEERNQVWLAKKIEASPSLISQWFAGNKPISEQKMAKIKQVIGSRSDG